MEIQRDISLNERVNDYKEKTEGKTGAVICSWCNKDMGVKEGVAGETSTICPECLENQFMGRPDLAKAFARVKQEEEDKKNDEYMS